MWRTRVEWGCTLQLHFRIGKTALHDETPFYDFVAKRKVIER